MSIHYGDITLFGTVAIGHSITGNNAYTLPLSKGSPLTVLTVVPSAYTSTGLSELMFYDLTAPPYNFSSSGSSVLYIDDLLDVNITSLSLNQTLKWNGSAWVNGFISGSAFIPYAGTGISITPTGSDYIFSTNLSYLDTRYSPLSASSFTPYAGTGISITPTGSDYIFSANLSYLDTRYTLATTTSSITGTIPSISSTTTTISGIYNVSSTQSIIYIDAANTVVLPITPITDESHWIVNIYTSDIPISGNGKLICLDGLDNTDINIPQDSSLHFHFNTVKNKWYII